jgi:ssDNA-binding Zn-finger/Zn-ribbon topoisomerase 1
MVPPNPEKENKRAMISAHVCPRCGFPIDLEELGLRGGTTGLVTCPKCDWSGPVEIRIINKKPTD